METTFSSEIYSYFKVLIVPCGMETEEAKAKYATQEKY